jgi:hypothetical protein
MKNVNLGFVQFIFMILIFLYLLVTLNSCNVNKNVALNGKAIIVGNIRSFELPNHISITLDTIKVNHGKEVSLHGIELGDDFRYDNLFN